MIKTKTLSGLLVATSMFLVWQPVQAGSNSAVIEAAKQEGALTYYTTMALSQSEKVVDRFRRLHTNCRASGGL